MNWRTQALEDYEHPAKDKKSLTLTILNTLLLAVIILGTAYIYFN